MTNMICVGDMVKFTDAELEKQLGQGYTTNSPDLSALLRGESVEVTAVYADKSAYVGRHGTGSFLALPLAGLEVAMPKEQP